jgi:hypothetical protein
VGDLYNVFSPNTIRIKKLRRMRCAGHEERTGEKCIRDFDLYENLDVDESDIKMNLKGIEWSFNCVNLVQDRGKLRTFVEKVNESSGSIKFREFLSGCASVSFLTRTQLHRVS